MKNVKHLPTTSRRIHPRRWQSLRSPSACYRRHRLQGPGNNPKIEGTIKATLSTDLAPVFQRQMQLIEDRRHSWLAKASQATPNFFARRNSPSRLSKSRRTRPVFRDGKRSSARNRNRSVIGRCLPGDSFILDFGEHITGHLILSLRASGSRRCAVRLSLIFGEVPAEVAEPFDPYRAG